MNFLDPGGWSDLDALAKEYEELSEDSIKELHARLKPYFLRRIKSEVLQLPPKVGHAFMSALCVVRLIIKYRMKSSSQSACHPCREKSTGRS